MADLRLSDRLQPSLLDRLLDEQPEKTVEPIDRRVMSMERLREAVIRDLEWLLNSTALGEIEDLEPYPEVEKSVLNYGMPDLSGSTLSSVDLPRLAKRIRTAIAMFEPRLGDRTLRVKLSSAEDEAGAHNQVKFLIEGELWAQPLPVHLYLRSSADFESGDVTIEEVSGPGGA